MASKRGSKRLHGVTAELRKEFLNIISLELDHIHVKLVIDVNNESNYKHWLAIINGPANTPYEGGRFQLEIKVGNSYPFRPPTVKCKTPIYHMNISERGRICLSILIDGWSPKHHKIIDILYEFNDLLLNPTIDSPLRYEISNLFVNDKDTYIQRATQMTLKQVQAQAQAQAQTQTESQTQTETQTQTQTQTEALPQINPQTVTKIANTGVATINTGGNNVTTDDTKDDKDDIKVDNDIDGSTSQNAYESDSQTLTPSLMSTDSGVSNKRKSGGMSAKSDFSSFAQFGSERSILTNDVSLSTITFTGCSSNNGTPMSTSISAAASIYPSEANFSVDENSNNSNQNSSNNGIIDSEDGMIVNVQSNYQLDTITNPGIDNNSNNQNSNSKEIGNATGNDNLGGHDIAG